MISAAIRRLKRFVATHTGVTRIRQSLESQRLTAERQAQFLERQQALLERQEQTLADLHESWRAARELELSLKPFAGVSFPVFLDAAMRPMAAGRYGSSPYRIVVCSIPKAGTYLVGELLALLGVTPTMLHLSEEGFTDYRFKTIQEMRLHYRHCQVPVPLAYAATLIRPGQFAVGHIGCNEPAVRSLEGFRKLFVHRNLRDALVSFLRFLLVTGRRLGRDEKWKMLPGATEQMCGFLDAAGLDFKGMCHLDWLDQPGVLPVSFETLYGDNGADAQAEAIRRIHEFVGVSAPLEDPSALVQKLIGRPTKTWSGERSRREEYWSAAVEARFCALNLHELNARLGYLESGVVGSAEALPRRAA